MQNTIYLLSSQDRQKDCVSCIFIRGQITPLLIILTFKSGGVHLAELEDHLCNKRQSMVYKSFPPFTGCWSWREEVLSAFSSCHIVFSPCSYSWTPRLPESISCPLKTLSIVELARAGCFQCVRVGCQGLAVHYCKSGDSFVFFHFVFPVSIYNQWFCLKNAKKEVLCPTSS